MGWFGSSSKRDGAGIPRRAERYQTNGLRCPLGDLVDLSASGMQIRCAKRPAAARGEIRQFTISTGSQKLELAGRVVWVRRAGWRGFRIGVHFVNLKPGTEAALVQLAKYGFVGGNSGASAAPPQPVKAAMEVEDLYQILGVEPQATHDQVHAAYRALARTVHPDVCKEPGASEHFALISKAYTVLKDPERRRKYDRLLAGCT
jgi:hypothetical protein